MVKNLENKSPLKKTKKSTRRREGNQRRKCIYYYSPGQVVKRYLSRNGGKELERVGHPKGSETGRIDFGGSSNLSRLAKDDL